MNDPHPETAGTSPGDRAGVGTGGADGATGRVAGAPDETDSVLQRASDRISDAVSFAALSARAGLRNVLSRTVFPASSETAQQIAGQASAEVAYAAVDPGAAVDNAGAGGSAGSNGTNGSGDDTDLGIGTEVPSGVPENVPPQVLNSMSDTELADLAARHELTPLELLNGMDNLNGATAAAGGSNRVNSPDPSIPQDPGVAAFFDVDNTLIKGASILLFARGLARRRFFNTGEVVGFVWKQLKYRVSGNENVDDIASGREQALELVKGHREAEIVQMAEEIWAATIAERIFPGTKELADMHLQAGQQVWLVTATPVQLAQIIARELGFTGALGTVAEVKDGVFTGRMVGDILHGSGKKHAVVALSAHENFDLSKCTAYSDSVNDLPLLSMVGTAVAVNPDSKLRKAAIANGWEVRDYRQTRRVLRRFGAAAASAGAAAAGGYWIKRH